MPRRSLTHAKQVVRVTSGVRPQYQRLKSEAVLSFVLLYSNDCNMLLAMPRDACSHTLRICSLVTPLVKRCCGMAQAAVTVETTLPS